MNCENIKEKLSLYIDELLDTDEAVAIKEHIANCDSCRTYYNKLLKLGEIVDDFAITDDEKYWEKQKDKVLEQIEQTETNKIIALKSLSKPNKFYKYFAVAASLALVALVSVYESQEFAQVSKLFDDSDLPTAPLKIEERAVPDGQVESFDDRGNINLNGVGNKPVIVTTSLQKRIVIKAPAVIERKENAVLPESPPAKPVMPEPSPEESKLELGEAIDLFKEIQLKPVLQSIEHSPKSTGVKPLSFDGLKVEAKKDKIELSPEEFQKRAVENQGMSDLDYKMSAMTHSSNEGKDYIPESPASVVSEKEEINIYKIKLDSLEQKYAGIYSPHYRESSAKGRIATSSTSRPASLDLVILEIAETCFQVGILSLEEQERNEMIDKLRRLSIHGNPETIEKIQRHIMILLASE